MTRVLYGLLAVVAAAAAVLSFSALRDLALACGFSRQLAWLLPVVVDAGAAAGSLVWLGGSEVADRARSFARGLALTLLVASIAANALGHYLAAYGLRPHWGVVVAVSAIAPAVLGAVVHLAVLAGRPLSDGATDGASDRGGAKETGSTLAGAVDVPTLLTTDAPAGELLRPVPPAAAPAVPPAGDDRETSLKTSGAPPPSQLQHAPELAADATQIAPDAPVLATGPPGRAADLIAAGAGRRRLARELQISEHDARQLLDRSRNGHQIGAPA